MQTLNTQNPDFISWIHEDIHFDILGGIRLEGLDRMRVTVRVVYDQIIIRHNVDLYNDNQLRELVRKCAERFEMSSSYMYPIIGELVNLLEEYRIQEIKSKVDNQKKKKKELSKKEAQAASQLLESKNLLVLVNDLIGQSGVIGEDDNRLLMYIIFTSRLMSNPLHVISMGASGIGKSHLQEGVAELIPEEQTLSVTDLTPSSFYYFKPYELSHKLILIEDLDGAESALYPLRELQSKKQITKTFVEKTSQGLRTTSRTVFGPVCVAGCTTKEHVYEDNSNRSFLIYIDDSQNQDDKIMAYQRALSAGEINESSQQSASELLKNSQRLLEPIKVINPFASQLVLPKSVFKPRRTNAHYLHFIEAVTFLHQRQRTLSVNKDTGEQYIETSLDDIKNANKLLKSILLKKSDRLNPATRSYFELLKAYLLKTDKQSFTHTDISYGLAMSLTRVKRYHYHLMDNNCLRMNKVAGDKSNQYQVVSYQEYQELQSELETELDKALERIKAKQASKRQKK
ncbi:MAG: hypothetical protein L3J01_05990 [Thiomicrorhabdus sp.]|nr:hypothetical protein [Thiomicrorhabdus sp.]